MALKIDKQKISINQIITEKKEMIEIETNEIVPDIKPDVLNIIDTDGTVCIYKSEVSDGKLKIDGTINMYIMYLADDDKTEIRALNTNLDFSKIIEIENLKVDMDVQVEYELKSSDCKVLNGRKINIKTQLMANVVISNNEDIEYIENIKNSTIQCLNKKFKINSMVAKGKTKVYAKDTINFDNTDNLLEIMKTNMIIKNKETKVSYNKLLIKADTDVKILYLTDDNRMCKASKDIPIMGFIDMKDVKEGELFDVNYEIKNMVVKQNNIEEHSVYVEYEIEITCSAYENKELTAMQDLYSTKVNLDFNNKTIKTMESKSNVEEIYNLRKQETLANLGNNKLYDVSVKPMIINTSCENGKIIYQGEIHIVYMYMSIITNKMETKLVIEPFDFEVTSKSISTKSKIKTYLEIAKKDFLVMADQTIEVKVDLKFNVSLLKEERINIIDNVEEKEQKNKSEYNMIIYYAKSEDTLWNIAKRFGSTIDNIVSANELKNEDKIKQGMQLFIPM